MSESRIVRVPFRDVPARTLVVSCCDGRYIDAVEQLLADQGVPNHDLISYPGGPAHLDPFRSYLEHQALSEALDFMVRAHRTERVVLIAHSDCAYYLSKHGTCEVSRQERDLQVAARQVQSRHEGVVVDLYYLSPLDEGRVSARQVPPASEESAWML